MQTLLNTFQCATNPNVAQTIAITEWFSQIKHTPDQELFSIVRKYKAESLAKPEDRKLKDRYDYFKSKNFPTICYNAIVDGYRKTSKYISSTGLMFIDADKNDFTLSNVDTNKLFAAYKSIGGKGYCLLVRVNGLTLENYEATFDFVIKDLNLQSYYDIDAKGMLQQSIISYDEDILINGNAFIYDSIKSDNQKSTTTIVIKKKENIYNDDSTFSQNVRYSNMGCIQLDSPWVTDFSGETKEVKCTIPMRKLTDGRKRHLIAYTCNYVYLNQWLKIENVEKTISNVNNLMCVTPLPFFVVQGIVKSIFQQKDEGRLQPIYNDRKIIFSCDSGLSKEEKLAVCSRENGRHRSEVKKNAISLAVQEWDFNEAGKITQTKIAKECTINILTVKKYWSEYKDLVKELNDKFKTNKKMKPIEKRDYLNQTTTTIATASTTPAEAIEGYYPEADAFEYSIGKNVYTFLNYSILLNQFKDEEQRLIKMQQMLIQENCETLSLNGNQNFQFNKFDVGGMVVIQLF